MTTIEDSIKPSYRAPFSERFVVWLRNLWHWRVLKGQRKALEAGQYRIHKYKPGRFWLENGIGEGMETTEAKVEKMLAEFFKREF